MTILISGDWHFSDKPRDQYRHDFQKSLRDMVRKHHAKAFIFLGDICEAKDNHHSALVNQVVDHFYKLSQLCPLVMIKGNHDYTDATFFSFLGHIENITWVEHPHVWEESNDLLPEALQRLGKQLWLPHTNNHKSAWQGVGLKDKWDWVFAHQTFDGADIGGRRLEGIPPSIFHKSTKIISGDIHVPQSFGNVTYAGAPYTVDFGDDYDPRILMIETGTIHEGKVRSIKCSGPQKRLVEVNSPSELHKQKGINPGDILKVRISLGMGDYARWSEIQDRTRAWGEENGYVIHMVQAIVESKPSMSKQRANVAPKSDAELFKTYAKGRNIDERTIKVGQEFVK